MSKAGQITNAIRGGIFIVAAAIFIFTLVVPAVTSYVSHIRGYYRATAVPQEVIRQDRESVFRRLCPDYAKATTWERWTNGHYREIAWCKDYVDRL